MVLRQILDEIGIDIRVELSLSSVVIDSDEFQIKKLVVDLVFVEHLADRRSENNHHEETDAGGNQSPLVLQDQRFFRLRASYLREQEHIQSL